MELYAADNLIGHGIMYWLCRFIVQLDSSWKNMLVFCYWCYNSIYDVYQWQFGEIYENNHELLCALSGLYWPCNWFTSFYPVSAYLLLQSLRQLWFIKACLEVRAWIYTTAYRQYLRPDNTHQPNQQNTIWLHWKSFCF